MSFALPPKKLGSKFYHFPIKGSECDREKFLFLDMWCFYHSGVHGPTADWTRDSSVQTRYFTTRLWALVFLDVGLWNSSKSFSLFYKNVNWYVSHNSLMRIYRKYFFLGGDPSAGSPTDTLWRLNLPCLTKIRLWRASPMQNSVGLTGSVCKRQGHIHRSLMINDYYGFQRHEARLQTSIWTKLQFMGLASPLGVASHWLQHCRARVAQGIRDVLT